MPTIHLSSTQERVETRRTLRDLENFLNYGFSKQEKLVLQEIKVHGHAVSCLTAEQVDWKNYPKFWWKDSLNLRKITQYINTKAATWSECLEGDAKKLVALERQCALLERVVDRHNQNNKVPDKVISFVNPFKKVIRVIRSYPLKVGQSDLINVIHKIYYDRLMPSAEFAKRIQEAIDAPLTVIVPTVSSLQSPQVVEYALNVSPKHLFAHVSQQPSNFFDPMDDVLREKDQIVQISYTQPDNKVLYALLHKAGENQALPSVYGEGFAAGKIAGFVEAIKKVEAAFSGKSP